MESAAKPRTNRDELESVATTRNHREEIAHSVSTTLDALFGEGYNKELRGQIKHTINLVEQTRQFPRFLIFLNIAFWDFGVSPFIPKLFF
jgi:NAD(P)H-hydrate repair Nnr-like enzyme with NAD(P)H-hydrate epimerase domain